MLYLYECCYVLLHWDRAFHTFVTRKKHIVTRIIYDDKFYSHPTRRNHFPTPSMQVKTHETHNFNFEIACLSRMTFPVMWTLENVQYQNENHITRVLQKWRENYYLQRCLSQRYRSAEQFLQLGFMSSKGTLIIYEFPKGGQNIQNVSANLWISSRVVSEKIIYIWLIYVKRHRQLVDFALYINFYLYYYYGKKYYCFLVQDR